MAYRGNWNYADIWEHVADTIPDATSAIHGDLRRVWRDTDARANGVAHHLFEAGLERQQAVAQYLYNVPEYLESMFAAFKGAFVPVNTNYRYTSAELLYLWDNADAGAVVFQGSFVDTIEPIRASLPKVRAWLFVDDGTNECPDWATPYEDAAAYRGERVNPGRTGDDLNMLYTGGTTGMPKGVMWRQDDLVMVLGTSAGLPVTDEGTPADLDPLYVNPRGPFLPACPLMHGTGNFPSLSTWAAGGAVVTLPGRSFNPIEILDTIERERVQTMSMVGDVFGKPILRALDENPGRWDLTSLIGITSSGVMWSQETKQGLLAHNPNMVLMDAFSSSEALGMGTSVSGAGAPGGGAAAATAKFQLTDRSIVIDDDNQPIQPGSDVIGRLAVGGRQPLGYYKDPDKTARTFLMINGERYSCPGDFATVDADGAITLLGRGSVCINTGGEKVFPEEVEEALKRHPAVADAVVVGIPHDKFGEMVVGMVELTSSWDGVEKPALAPGLDLFSGLRAELAGYKTPKMIMFVDSVGRAPNGKVDYKAARAKAITARDTGSVDPIPG